MELNIEITTEVTVRVKIKSVLEFLKERVMEFLQVVDFADDRKVFNPDESKRLINKNARNYNTLLFYKSFYGPLLYLFYPSSGY